MKLRLEERWDQISKAQHQGVDNVYLTTERDYNYKCNTEEDTAIPAGLAEESLRILLKKKLDATEEEVVKRNISINPDILSGVPVISDTRIPVYLILECLSGGRSFSEIRHEFPSVESDEQIEAAVLFASEMCYSSLE